MNQQLFTLTHYCKAFSTDSDSVTHELMPCRCQSISVRGGLSLRFITVGMHTGTCKPAPPPPTQIKKEGGKDGIKWHQSLWACSLSWHSWVLQDHLGHRQPVFRRAAWWHSVTMARWGRSSWDGMLGLTDYGAPNKSKQNNYEAFKEHW